MCLILGHLKTVNFPFGTNGKLRVLGVPILKHYKVFINNDCSMIVKSKDPESLKFLQE